MTAYFHFLVLTPNSNDCFKNKYDYTFKKNKKKLKKKFFKLKKYLLRNPNGMKLRGVGPNPSTQLPFGALYST